MTNTLKCQISNGLNEDKNNMKEIGSNYNIIRSSNLNHYIINSLIYKLDKNYLNFFLL